MNSDRQSRSSVEKLLQFKRLEKPAPEFWADFDKKLRAKQLVAIMEDRRWWASCARILAGLLRHPAPLGAAAALAVTALGFHEYRIFSARHSEEAPIAPAAAVAVIDMPAAPAVAIPKAIAGQSVAPVAVAVAVRPAPLPVALARGDGNDARVDSGAVLPEAVNFASASGARLVPASFAMTAMEDSEGARSLFGLAPAFSTGNHVQATRGPAVDPLARMTSQVNERRARILMDVFPATPTATEAASPSSDRIVKRLSDDRLYESISRYGASGDRFSVKF